ncbi:MAG: hypothetical protein A2V98_10430 [Planctomycetes bacterium RBG_16_64_12]|nr:MAG: hypothetical protein A2V98_10430 [Planctomycetes bacterium RBG_16_64_12]
MIYQKSLGSFYTPTELQFPHSTWQVFESAPTVCRVTAIEQGPSNPGPARLVYDPILHTPVLFGADDGVDVAPFDLTLPF